MPDIVNVDRPGPFGNPYIPARIKALAEMEGPCPGNYHDFTAKAKKFPHLISNCKFCSGTGHKALFKELRTPCQILTPDLLIDTQLPRWEERLAEIHVEAACLACCGRGWVPEPDIEKACHRIAEFMEQQPQRDGWWGHTDGYWWWTDGKGKLGGLGFTFNRYKVATYKEAVISAVEAWATKEQVR